jgi:hypothetical protein
MCLKTVIMKPRKMRLPRPPRGCRAIGPGGGGVQRNVDLVRVVQCMECDVNLAMV